MAGIGVCGDPSTSALEQMLMLTARALGVERMGLTCQRRRISWFYPSDPTEQLLPLVRHAKKQYFNDAVLLLLPVLEDDNVVATLGVWQHKDDFPPGLEQVAELFAQELKLRDLLSHVPLDQTKLKDSPVVMVMWEANPALPVCFISDNAQALLGMDVMAIRSGEARFEDWLNDDDVKAFLRLLNAHVRGARQSELDYRLKGANGKVHWVRQYSVAQYDINGNVTAIYGYLLEQTHRKLLELQIKATRDRLSMVMEASAMGVADWDLLQDQLLLSPQLSFMLGVSPEELEPCLHSWQQFIHPADSAQVEEALKRHLAALTKGFHCEYRIIRPSGDIRWLESHGRVVEYSKDGEPLRMLFMHQDISARKSEERARERQQALLNLIHQAQSQFLEEQNLSASCDGIFESLLAIAESQFGFISEVHHTEKGLPYMRVQTISDISWDATSRALYQKHIESGLEFHNMNTLFGQAIVTGKPVISNNVRRDPHSGGTPKGHPPLESFLGLPISYRGELLGVVGLANRSEGYSEEEVRFLNPLIDTLGMLMHARLVEKARCEAEAELALLASTDMLTGLLNRRAFMRAMNEIIDEGQKYTLVVMDLDHFKLINDTFGHSVGDQVLKHFADIIKEHVESTDVLARIGGEEFVWLFKSKEPDNGYARTEKVREAVCATPLVHNGKEVTLTVSLGVTVLGGKDKNGDEALNRADAALYEAKKKGRNQTVAA
ncbi:GGDEF domain-containing protein [Gallaecimonas mangrovi]|uniref:GGDEF domain-containing protein n=1 Tax=Gallaecimonas mangrovi TaxID=2291597 RepID=UPI000E204B7D|nr:sensor domain-containing diguanylate cyclase [Gallaecimonas mangrovi]